MRRRFTTDIETCARRELYEETGVRECGVSTVCAYAVVRDGEDPGRLGGCLENMRGYSYGMLFLAEILEPGEPPAGFGMERTALFDELPDNWTYPDIQPFLLKYAEEALGL